MEAKTFNVHVIDEEGDLVSESTDVPWADVPKLMQEFLERMEQYHIDDNHRQWGSHFSVLVSLVTDDPDIVTFR